MAIQINPLALSQLKLALHNDFHNQVYNLITGATPEALHVEEKAPLYLAVINRENAIVKRQTTYVSTALLKEADRKRDRALGCLMNCIVAHRTSVISEKRDAALALDAMIAPYRGIGSHEYRTETREIAGLLAVLATDEAKAHIETLNLTEEVEALDMANAQFDSMMTQKQQEESSRTEQTSIDTTELRSEIDGIYSEIAQIVNAYAVIQTSEVIEQFITDVNAVITLVKRSASSGGDSEEEETTTEEENA